MFLTTCVLTTEQWEISPKIQNESQIIQRHAHYMSNICPRYAQDMPKNMFLKICQRYAHDLPEDMPEDMPKDMPEY